MELERREWTSPALAPTPHEQRQLWRQRGGSRPAMPCLVAPPPATVVVEQRRAAESWLARITLSLGGAVFGQVLAWQVQISMTALGIVFAGGAVAFALDRRLHFLWRLTTAWRARGFRKTTLKGVAPGTRVFVRGRVLPGSSFRTPGGEAAVVAAYTGERSETSGARASFEPQKDVHARDFDLLIVEDQARQAAVPEVVPIAVAGLRWLGQVVGAPTTALCDRPPLHSATTVHEGGDRITRVMVEEAIGPGDLIEVLGVVHLALDRTAGAAGSRTPPLRTVLRGERGRPLLVRKVR